MTLTNYKTANNANSTLASGIGAGATSLVCATGEGGRFPSTFPFLMTIEKIVAGVVTKRDIVKVTNRAGDAFTIVRSAGYCLASDSATTQTNTAQSFDSGDVISHRLTGEIIDDLNAEAVRLESAKLDKSGGTITGLIQGAKSANIASATTTNLANATGNEVHITGTTTITGLGTVTAGTQISLIFDGILTFTHNVTSLILPGSTNITTAAGDIAIMVSEGSGNWKCLSYTRADGTALAGVNITALTEDTAGDMNADFALVYDNSAGANRKQKANVYRADNATATAKSSNTKFTTPAHLALIAPNNQKFQTYAFSALPASFAVAHGLSIAPSFVRVKTFLFNVPIAASSYTLGGEGTYKSGTYSTWYVTTTTGNPPTPSGVSTTASTISQLQWDNNGTADDLLYTMTISSIDATNINFAITRTLGGSVSGNVLFIVEFEI